MSHPNFIPSPAMESPAVRLEMNSAVNGVPFGHLPLTQTVEYPAPRVDPLCYPGLRPEHGFTVFGESVLPARVVETESGLQFGVNTPEGVVDLNDFLIAHGTLPMEERTPIVGFGSNACPGQLAEKFTQDLDKKGDITNEADRYIVPTLTGKMHDVAAAYSSKIGIRGYVFAELIEAVGAETDVYINFLTPGQLERMKRSESAYELCDLGDVAIDGMKNTLPAYGFAGKNEVLLDVCGRPILLESVHSTGSGYSSMTQVELLDMLARDFGMQLDRAYPLSPFFADSAANLMAYVSYRQDFLRRADTKAMTYLHKPEADAEPDELIAVTLQKLLRGAGRVSNDKILDHISDENRNIDPKTFGALY